MTKAPVQTLKGFRDLLPPEKRQRDWVATQMKAAFERFGFAPLETPTLEYADLLLGKYGDEADKLVYTFTDRGDRQIGLRYDQTVPTARVLSQYRNELPTYFRRYQIQNVFRADKPQRGRYREFTQCDCDIFGSTATIADAEILAVFYSAYEALGLNVVLNYNDRQTLFATFSPFATDQVNVASIIQSIDKLDKLPPAVVQEELEKKGLTKNTATEVLTSLENMSPSENVQKIIAATIALGVPAEALVFNPRLARGLDYYTGLIFEGMIPDYTVGSVGGGGRYDNLIESLGGQATPAVGFGIGFDRSVEAAVQAGVIPTDHSQTKVLVTTDLDAPTALSAAAQLRAAGISVEVFPNPHDALAKQLKLANQKNIPYVLLLSEATAQSGSFTLKTMSSGDQRELPLETIITELR